MNELLKPYVPLVDYLGRVFGKNCEVILHDLTNIESSIVAIANGDLTARQVGGHITDFGLAVVHDPRYRNEPYAINYPGTTPDGARTLKSSTFFIRDEEDDIIGMFCINIDITDWKKAQSLIEQFTAFTDTVKEERPAAGQAPIQEVFSSSVEGTLQMAIERAMSRYQISPQRMTVDEKKHIVESLQTQGVFALKGAVSMVAKQLDVSEQTVYRYLREIQNT